VTKQENEISPAAKKLFKLAKSRNYDELESAWLETVQADPRCVDDVLPTLDLLVRREDTELAESLLSYLLIEQADQLDVKETVATIAKAASLLPRSESLRSEAVELYRRAFASFPFIEAIMQATLGDDDAPLPDAIARTEKLLTLARGTYVLDGKNPGRVQDFDKEKKALVVEFPKGEKMFDVSSVKGLTILDPNDFRALAAFDRGRLQQFASEDPGELVVGVMRAFGRELSYRDIRERMKDVLDTPWSKWWSESKLKIKRSPWLDVSEGTQPKFVLRREPVALEERVREDFDSAKSFEKKLTIVLDYLDEIKGEDADLLRYFTGQIVSLAQDAADARPHAAVATLALIDRLRQELPDIQVETLGSLEGALAAVGDPADILRFTLNDNLAARILEFIRASQPERWHDLYARILPGASVKACERIVSQLLESGREDAVKTAVSRVVAEPDRNPLALIWLWKAICAEEHPDVLQHIDRVAVLLSLLRLAHDAKRKGSSRDDVPDEYVLSEIRSAISAKNYAVARRIVLESGGHRAKEIRDVTERNLGLGEHAKSEILHALHEVHGEQFAETVAPWEEDAIYSTQQGLKKRRGEHAHLVNVELAQAEKDIGKAASFGDLSENAEYTAAIEHRERLARKAGMMMEELSKARPITQNMVHTDSVTVGTQVKARNLNTGAEESFVFLGPWDADAEKGIYSYLAPLSLAFMGKKVGDTVTFGVEGNERKWEILEIASAI